jgi:hypothetical protein
VKEIRIQGFNTSLEWLQFFKGNYLCKMCMKKKNVISKVPIPQFGTLMMISIQMALIAAVKHTSNCKYGNTHFRAGH